MADQEPKPTTRDDAPAPGERQLRIPLDPPMLVVIGLAAVGLLLMCVFGSMLLAPEGGWFGGGGDETGEAQTDASTPGPIETPSGENIVVVSDGLNTLSIDLDPPQSLVIGANTFPVQAQFVAQNGRWQPAAPDDTVEWVYGTIVNYVFGLPGTAANRALLEGLVPGDRLQMTTLAGGVREFVVTGREQTAAPNEELFAQNRPRLTLLWLDDDAAEQRLVVYADFVLPESQQGAPADQAAVELGQTAQLADIRVTVNSTSQIVDSPAAPPGFSVFLLDFELENIGLTPLDTGLLRLVLVDALGNQYSLNAAASQEGRFPILSGFVDAGAAVQAAAGYQVPANLNSDVLRWVISRVDSPGQIEVRVPYTASGAGQAQVSLQQAEISSDGTSLILSGQITNLGSQPLVVSENAVSLESSGARFLVFSTNPGFPWSVNAGESLPFVLTFQRPSTGTAVFTVLSQSFELNGLR